MTEPFQVKFRLVADINKKGDGARVVPDTVRETKPRVDIKTEVETSGAKPIKAKHSDGRAQFDGTAGNAGANDAQRDSGPVTVGKGGGVLGHLIGSKRDIPDPGAMSWQQLRAALQPHFGKPVVITTYDREESKSLAEAAKSHSIGDDHGVLRDVTVDGIELEKGGKRNTVKTEFWAIARVKVDGGDVIAQDPTYPKHFSD